jgi:hypothetical protein
MAKLSKLTLFKWKNCQHSLSSNDKTVDTYYLQTVKP